VYPSLNALTLNTDVESICTGIVYVVLDEIGTEPSRVYLIVTSEMLCDIETEIDEL